MVHANFKSANDSINMKIVMGNLNSPRWLGRFDVVEAHCYALRSMLFCMQLTKAFVGETPATNVFIGIAT